jgi:hypothetical protein
VTISFPCDPREIHEKSCVISVKPDLDFFYCLADIKRTSLFTKQSKKGLIPFVCKIILKVFEADSNCKSLLRSEI